LTADDTPRGAPLDIEPIRARHAAATPGPYRWAGNTDYGDVRLAARGGSEVFALIDRERSVDDPQSRAYASYLSDISEVIDGRLRALTEGEIAERVRAAIAYDEDEEQPPTYPAIAFYRPGFAYEHAVDHVTYEVTRYQDLPEDTPRSHPRIYRADVVDVRNPNARFLRDSWEDVRRLLVEVDRQRAEVEQARAEWDAAVAQVSRAVCERGELETAARQALSEMLPGCAGTQTLRAALARTDPTTAQP
jgi:hypothetical protein